MKHLIILIISLLSFSNIYAQISGDDIIDPLWSDNNICIYLKEFTSNINVIVYNNYEDSTVYINEVYIINNNNILDKKTINNNQNINEVNFDIDEDQIYNIIVTTNRDNWKITFDKYSECYWYNMEICIFTKIIERTYKRDDNRIYNINGILMNNFNSKFYIYNRKKYIKR